MTLTLTLMLLAGLSLLIVAGLATSFSVHLFLGSRLQSRETTGDEALAQRTESKHGHTGWIDQIVAAPTLTLNLEP